MNAAAQNQRLICSFRAAGGIADSCLQVTPLSGSERGICAGRSDICRAAASSSPLVHVPAQLIITAAVSRQSEVVRACLSCIDEASEALQLALFVLTERADGAASTWHWYLESLPTSGTGALFFDDAALEALTGTPLRVAADAKQRQLRAQFEAFSGVLDGWKAAKGTPGPVDYEAYKWATFIVLSRSISLHSCHEFAEDKNWLVAHSGCDRALVPLLDMLNHSSDPLAHWTVGADGAVSVFANAPPDSENPAMKEPPAVELCFSYGEKPNTEWLYEYGFVPEKNEHDSWPYFSPLSGSPPFVAVKRMWMVELGLTPRVMLSDPDSSNGSYGIPRPDMLSLCLAALDDTSDAFLRQIGTISLDHPCFMINGQLVDDDDKLLQVPGLCAYALALCSRRLKLQAEAMHASLESYLATSVPQHHAAVSKYLASELALVWRIASKICT
ncbi:hypothetical protein GGI22_005708 [Coemansia erecta]|nr:hypothetical protein GGI22_005708 [Coemansia erecta]